MPKRSTAFLGSLAIVAALLSASPMVQAHAEGSTCAAPPPAPTNVRATVEGDGLRFTWDSAPGASDYLADRVYFRPTDQQRLPLATLAEPTINVPFSPDWNGISLFVTARNACGQSGWTLHNSPLRLPYPASDLHAFPDGPDIAVLWSLDPRDNGWQFDERIRATAEPGGRFCEAIPNLSSGCRITGLKPGRNYQVQVISRNQLGTVRGPTLSRHIPVVVGPSAPRTVRATAGMSEATVAWRQPLSDGGRGITHYTVTSVPEGRTCRTGTLRCTVTGLASGRSYRFAVVAHNSRASGSPGISPTVTTTTPAPATTPDPNPAPDPDPKPSAPIS